jgi:hypothetical protein
MSSPFSSAHRLYVKSLYKRFLNNELNWVVNRTEWRARALAIRAEFERNRYALRFNLASNTWNPVLRRNIHDPRALAVILEKAENYLAERKHPDPYIRQYTPEPSSFPF